MNPVMINQIFSPIDKSIFGRLAPVRILWFDRDADVIVLIALDIPARRPFEYSLKNFLEDRDAGRLRPIQLSPRRVDGVPEEDMLQRAKDSRDEAWRRISPLVADANIPRIYSREDLGRLVLSRAKEIGVDKKALYRALYAYWIGGSTINALLPRYDDCGPNGTRAERRQKKQQAKRGRKARVSVLHSDPTLSGPALPSCRTLIVTGIARFLKPGVKVVGAWRETKKHLFSKGSEIHRGKPVPIEPARHEAPSLRQFRYVLQQEDSGFTISKRRIDTATWRLRNRAVLGRVRDGVFGPGARFEIDATIVDIYLVSVFNRQWIIGRPVLYVVIDEFSRMVVGFYLGLEGPSWEGARLALFNAFTDKVDFCRRYGVEIGPDRWPCHHLPHKILGDRGELISKASDELARSMGIVAQNCGPLRGDWKPFVEQNFNLVNTGTIQFLPGAIAQRWNELRERKYVLDGCLNLLELGGVLTRHFLRYNGSHYKGEHLPEAMLADNLTDATPMAVWNWGIENFTGKPRDGSDRQKAWTHLLERGTAVVRADGIFFKGLRYSGQDALNQNWFSRARTKGRWSLDIRYHRGTPSMIWIQNQESREWKPCELLDVGDAYRHAQLEEIIDRSAVLELSKCGKQDEVRQENARIEAEITDIVSNAQQKTKAARQGMTKSELTDGIAGNRAFEKEAFRVVEARREIESRTAQPAGDRKKAKVVPINPGARNTLAAIDDAWGRDDDRK